MSQYPKMKNTAILLALVMLLNLFGGVGGLVQADGQTNEIILNGADAVRAGDGWSQSTTAQATVSDTDSTKVYSSSTSGATAAYTIPEGTAEGNYEIWMWMTHQNGSGILSVAGSADFWYDKTAVTWTGWAMDLPDPSQGWIKIVNKDTKQAEFQLKAGDTIVLKSGGVIRSSNLKLVKIEDETEPSLKPSDEPQTSVEPSPSAESSPSAAPEFLLKGAEAVRTGDGWSESGSSQATVSDTDPTKCFYTNATGAYVTYLIPDEVEEGTYEIKLWLSNANSSGVVSIAGGTEFWMDKTAVDWTGWAMDLSDSSRGWITLANRDTLQSKFTLKGGDSIVIKSADKCYIRSTDIKLIKSEGPVEPSVPPSPSVIPGELYLNETFDEADTGAAPSGWTGGSNGQMTIREIPNPDNKSMEISNIGPVQYDTSAPALSKIGRGEVVFDTMVRFDKMYSKTTFLLRTSGNLLFAHFEFQRFVDGKINLMYYDGASIPSSTWYDYSLEKWYRVIALFHTEAATYDLFVFNGETMEKIDEAKGIHPKNENITTQNADIKSFSMQNHNSNANEKAFTYMDYVKIYDGTEFSVEDIVPTPLPPMERKEVILDNGADGYQESTAAVDAQGDLVHWQDAESLGAVNGNARIITAPGAWASWSAVMAQGYYRVSINRAADPSYDNETKVDISYNNGNSASHSIDFSSGEDGWVPLGTYYFNERETAVVKLTTGTKTGFADAVKFEPVEASGIMIDSLKAYDGQGREVDGYQPGKLKLETTIRNTGAAVTMKTLAAVYSADGTLLDSSLSETVPLAAGASVTQINELTVPQEDTIVKLFVWESLSSLKPMTDPVILYPEKEAEYEHFLLRPESFIKRGTWGLTSDYVGAYDGTVLNGLTNKDKTAEDATTKITVKKAGEYRVWVRSRNFEQSPQARHFALSINGTRLSKTFGQVGTEGFVWEDGGTVTLSEGENTVNLIDSSQYYAKVDSVMITNHTKMTPPDDYETLKQITEPYFPESKPIEGFTISKDHPGGNIIVDGMWDDVVKVQQDLTGNAYYWFYWNFAAVSDIDRTITFEFSNGDVVGDQGPAYSFDGINWNWLGDTNTHTRTSFKYDFKAGQKVYFTLSIPYQYKELNAFLDQYDGMDRVSKKTIGQTEDGRDIPIIEIGNPNAQKHMVFTSRHHCCESTTSFVLEGLIQYMVNQRNSAMLDEYLVHIVPMIDIDGVENGDQGKMRKPHDHNRDYIANPIFNTTKAVYSYFGEMDVDLFMDFHCPGLYDTKPYIYRINGANLGNIDRFADILSGITQNDSFENKIVYDRSKDFTENMVNETSYGYFSRRGASLSTSMEVPYNGTAGNPYTKENLRNLGKNFGEAFEEYLGFGQ